MKYDIKTQTLKAPYLLVDPWMSYFSLYTSTYTKNVCQKKSRI